MAQYDTSLSRLLDKLAPLKNICSVDRPMSDWMTGDIRALKAKRRKNCDQKKLFNIIKTLLGR